METKDFDFILGKDIFEARKIVGSCVIVETRKDGHDEYISAEYNPKRVRVHTKNNIIIKIDNIG